MEKLSILIVDDHKLIRDTLTLFLNRVPGLVVVANTGNGEDGIALAKSLRPNIVIIDVNMLPMSGFETAIQIHKDVPGSKIIGISMDNIPSVARKLLAIGAMGYICKDCSLDEIVHGIREVGAGKKYISGTLK